MAEDEFEYEKPEDINKEAEEAETADAPFVISEEPEGEEAPYLKDEADFEEEAAEESAETDREDTELPVFEENEIYYIPAKEKAKKEKKPFPTWLTALITSILTCSVMLLAYTAVMLPYMHKKPAAVISQIKEHGSEKFKDKTDKTGAVAEKNMSGVVTVLGKMEYESFFGVSTQKVSGTGMIVSDNGYILTSSSLIGAKGSIKVKAGGEELDAEVIGRDAQKDLAVIKINKEGLSPVNFGDSDGVSVGDSVIAIADVFGSEIGFSVSKGIICGVNNGVALENGTSINLLQTDAAPDKSCSGGCLLDARGNVIGMLTNSISANSDKISFAIPSNDIVKAMETIIDTGSAPESLVIGIKGADADHGVTVEAVVENTPAEKAGVKRGDLILKVDGETVKSVNEINRIRDSHKKGDTIELTVYRDGEMIKIKIEL